MSDAPAILRMSPSTSETVAHHEAGHAVAAIAWVGRVHEVSIEPVEGVRLGGTWTRSNGMLDMPKQLAEQMRKARDRGDEPTATSLKRILFGHARYCLAGYVSEFAFRQLRRSVASIIDPDVEEARLRCALAVERPVEDLLVDLLVAAEVRHTRRFLRVHRQHVAAVAAALLKQRTLDERGFHRALRGLGPIVIPREIAT